MNKFYNPIFAFKRLFGDENADMVVSRLRCHPLIWNSINSQQFFNLLIESLGSEIENWTPKNICFYLSDITNRDVNLSSGDHDQNSQEIESHLLDLYRSVLQVNEQRRLNKSWDDIFEIVQINSLKETEIIRKWGTVFDICANTDSDLIDLMKSLVGDDPKRICLLSFLLNISNSPNSIEHFINRNFQIFQNKPRILRKLAAGLEKIGGFKKAEILVKHFFDRLDHHDIDVKIGGKDINQIAGIEEIEKNNELRILATFLNNNEKSDHFKDLTKRLITRTLALNPIKLYEKEIKIDDEDLLSLDFFLSVEPISIEKNKASRNKNLKDLFRAFYLLSSDEMAAREICRQFLDSYQPNKIAEEIFSNESGYVIDPIDIAKLFIKLNFKHEAVQLLELISETSQKNNKLLKFLAHYLHILGDHQRAVKHYSILFSDNNLTRKEKIYLSKSLKYLEMWEESFIVMRTINKLDITDKLEFAIAAFRADKETQFTHEIEEILSTTPNQQTAKVVKALFLQRKKDKYHADISN